MGFFFLLIKIELHQELALSQYLFTLVMDELNIHIQEDILLCTLFADDIVLVDETKDGVNRKFRTLEEYITI
ncbi:hypothetical protein Syun_015492 [Stephania yunnanensis]|uniref:Reverse transcriptase domain-containing protein n=1 Tax=Stephania yunnanensis TaxID=152371 RepID=A0AAP0P9S0_9MAGN